MACCCVTQAGVLGITGRTTEVNVRTCVYVTLPEQRIAFQVGSPKSRAVLTAFQRPVRTNAAAGTTIGGRYISAVSSFKISKALPDRFGFGPCPPAIKTVPSVSSVAV